MKMYQIEIFVTEDMEVMLLQDDDGGEDRILLTKEQAEVVGKHLIKLAKERDGGGR